MGCLERQWIPLQTEHLVLSAVIADPAPQSSLHNVLPTVGAYVPVPQILHDVLPTVGAYVPVSQSGLAPSLKYLPCIVGTTTASPPLELNLWFNLCLAEN